MKGTFAQAELHIIRARLHGGKLNKASIAGRRVVIQAVDANHSLRDRDHSDWRGTGGA